MKEVTVIERNTNFVEAANMERENQLTFEIRTIKSQTEQMVLMSSIELGKRLTEAKELVKHGEWENWLKERVKFTSKTARNLMAIYREYGATGLAENRKSISVLSYTQALELLALPADTREQFAEENDVKDMTIKELKAEIKAVKEEKAASDTALSNLKAEHEKLQKDNETKIKELETLNGNIANLQEQQKEAAEKQDKELTARLEKSIKAELDKIAVLEKEKTVLSEKIAEVEKSKKEAVENARKQEQDKSQKAIDKKTQEIEKASSRFTAELEKVKAQSKADLDKAKEQAKNEKQKTRQAEAKANLSREIVRCEMLLDNMKSDFDELKTILNRMQKTYPENVREIEAALADILKAMERRSRLHAVS